MAILRNLLMVVVVRCESCGRVGVRFGFDRLPVWYRCSRCNEER